MINRLTDFDFNQIKRANISNSSKINQKAILDEILEENSYDIKNNLIIPKIEEIMFNENLSSLNELAALRNYDLAFNYSIHGHHAYDDFYEKLSNFKKIIYFQYYISQYSQDTNLKNLYHCINKSEFFSISAYKPTSIENYTIRPKNCLITLSKNNLEDYPFIESEKIFISFINEISLKSIFNNINFNSTKITGDNTKEIYFVFSRSYLYELYFMNRYDFLIFLSDIEKIDPRIKFIILELEKSELSLSFFIQPIQNYAYSQKIISALTNNPTILSSKQIRLLLKD